MSTILERIASQKREEVATSKKKSPMHTLSRRPPLAIRDFTASLYDNSTPAIIAEIKRASPSQGIIREDFDVATIASAYTQNGARCLSVLTDIEFFQGHPDFLLQAKTHTTLPVLRKDFIIDAYQIHESVALGADCILLIVALLDDIQLRDFCNQAHELGLAVLVESHTRAELDRALLLPTTLMGINNRNLHTFKTDIQLTLELSQYVPKDKLLITESGINTRADIALMQAHNINTFLIGEYFMRANDIGGALKALIEGNHSPQF
jgi:indole-3-glycerol phosphate synthase